MARHVQTPPGAERESDMSVTPSFESARAALQEAERRTAFWQDHHRELLERYPEQFVAVRDGIVEAADSDMDKLLGILKNRRIDPREVWVKFITADVRHVAH